MTAAVEPSPRALAAGTLGVVHRRRLRAVWRSAGWPCHDMVEVELLAAGWVERVRHASGHETLRVSDSGVAVLAETLQRNRAARDAHEALVARVAVEMGRAGRLAWCGLGLRAPIGPPERPQWVVARPDVFSIRRTSVEAYLEPVVHEIKVRRADLLADLRQASKREAYLQLGGECWYVIAEGIAQADEIPPTCGVLVARAAGTSPPFDVARPAPRRAVPVPLHVWMALARATPAEGAGLEFEGEQGLL